MKIAEKVVVAQSADRVNFNFKAIPKHEMDAICRDLLYSIKESAKNPAFVADYREWLIKRYGKREGQRRFKKEGLCGT